MNTGHHTLGWFDIELQHPFEALVIGQGEMSALGRLLAIAVKHIAFCLNDRLTPPKSDGTKLLLSDGCLDGLTTRNTLIYVDDPLKTLGEFKWVLTINGKLWREVMDRHDESDGPTGWRSPSQPTYSTGASRGEIAWGADGADLTGLFCFSGLNLASVR